MCVTEFNDELYAAQRLEEGIEIGLERGLEQRRKQCLEQGFEQGFEQGLKQGEIRAKKAMAKKLVQKGWSVEDTAVFLDVSAVDAEIWLNEK